MEKNIPSTRAEREKQAKIIMEIDTSHLCRSCDAKKAGVHRHIAVITILIMLTPVKYRIIVMLINFAKVLLYIL